jgi:hypothetical protein
MPCDGSLRIDVTFADGVIDRRTLASTWNSGDWNNWTGAKLPDAKHQIIAWRPAK